MLRSCKIRKILVNSYAQNVQTQAKCPHGFPVGTCPICSGMMGGGVSKNRNKPRVAGEMSYNECLAEWHRILAKKEAKTQKRLDKLEALRQNLFSEKISEGVTNLSKNFDKFNQKIQALPSFIKTPIKIFSSLILNPIVKLVSKIPSLINNVQTFFDNVKNFTYSVSEKMASIFGEIKNFINDAFTKKYKKTIKTILSLFTTEEDEESEEAKKLNKKEVKKILKSIFKTKKKMKEKDDKNELV